MIIENINVLDDYTLEIVGSDKKGLFDVKPYLNGEVFKPLQDKDNFAKIINGGYFIEWECGADLSADTIEYNLKEKQ
jgi:hypothetical protein